MADTPPPPSSAPSTPPSSAADQARIRKERREAKIRAGGSARLNKISGLGGGLQRDAPPQPTVSSHGDPDEVDISQHYYAPKTTSRPLPDFSQPQQQGLNDDALRQMMLGFDPSSTSTPPPSGAANPFAGLPGMEGLGGGAPGAAGEDPIMKMMQQMMGGAAGEGMNGMPSFPGMPGQTEVTAPNPYAYLWRVIHAVFALSLGLYIAFTTTFTGTKLERERSGFNYNIAGEETGLSASSVRFFWIFATAEVVLQSSRFWMEKGVAQQTGILSTVIGFLPEPWKGYVELLARYSRIWTTISGDAMVCVFVLGVCAWVRGS